MIHCKVFVFCTLLCVVSGNDFLLTKQKRQLFEHEENDGINGDFGNYDNWHQQHHHHYHHHDGHFETPHLQNHDEYHKHKVKTIIITKKVPVPYEVIVEKKVPYKVEVPVDKPYHVYIPKPYPVYVEKKVPYKVEVPIPKPYTVEKKIPVPVKVPIDKPYPVYVPKPYKVYVEKKVPYTLEKHVPFLVKVPIEKPYPVHVKVEKEIPYKVEKIVPYPVEVKVDKPIPVHVEKPIPINVEKPVPYPVEKVIRYPVKVPVKIPIEVPYTVNIHEENEDGFEEGSPNGGSFLGENGGSYGVQKEEFGGSSNSKGNFGDSGFGGGSVVNSFRGYGGISSCFGSSSNGFGESSGETSVENSNSKNCDSSSQFGDSSGGYDDNTGSGSSHFGDSSAGFIGSSGDGSSGSRVSNANKNNHYFGGSFGGFGDSTGSGSSHGYKNQFGGSSVSFSINSENSTNVRDVSNVNESSEHFGGRNGGFGDSSRSSYGYKKNYRPFAGLRSSSGGGSASISDGSHSGYENSGQFGGNSGISPGGSGRTHGYRNHRHFDAHLTVSIGLAAVIFTLVVVFIGCLLWRKRRNPETDSLAPHILVYPSYQGDAAPQLITNEIDFQLPQMRKTESLDDLLPEMEEVKDTKPRQLQHRSNSFSGGYVGLGGLNPDLYRNPSELEDELHYPEGHLGRVWFYLRYEPGCEKLLVTLLKMKNLPSRTVGTANGCDPIVKLHLVPNERRVQQSRQKKKTCNPFFDETFVFQVSEKELADHSLTMTVIDSGRNKKNCTIGHVTFPLRHLATEHPTDQLELLKMDLEKECDGPVSDLGELLVSLFYNENLHRLTVSVIAARNLKFPEETKEDSYVRLTLNQHWHTVKVKRTNVVRGSAEPKYSQGFNFRVPSSNVDVTSLAFQIYQPAQGYGKDKLLGKCVLGSYMFARGKALTHWNSAFANPMEQIQNWQPLTE